MWVIGLGNEHMIRELERSLGGVTINSGQEKPTELSLAWKLEPGGRRG